MRGVDEELFYAIRQGNLNEVKECLNEGANIHIRDIFSRKPIHVAAREGHQEIIEFLLSKGASVDDTDEYSWTPLHWAALSGKLETTKFFLDNGADVYAKNNEGETPLDFAREKRCGEIVDILSGTEKQEKKSPTYASLRAAVRKGNLKAVKYFIRKGADINDSNKDGHTPLHCAAEIGNLEIIKLLLNKGANIHAKSVNNDKALHSAARYGQKDAVEFLLDKGISISDTNRRGWTPLHFAAKCGKLDLVEFLVDKGADIYAMNYDESTPLDLARAKGHAEIVIYLKDEMFYKQGKYTDALQTYQEMLDIQKVKLGSDHPNTLTTRHNIAVELKNQGKHDEALQIYREVFKKREVILGPDHPDTLTTRHNIAVVLGSLGKRTEALQIYQEVLDIQKVKLSFNHPDTLRTYRNIVRILFRQGKQDEVLQIYRKMFDIQDVSIKPVEQGLYLPSFEKRGIKIRGECATITRGLSQVLFLHGDKSFLSNLETSVEIYERIAQGKQISKREEREVFAFSKLLNDFKRQLSFFACSLPLSLIHNRVHKTFSNLSNDIAEIEANFAIHLVTDNHVVAIYRIDDNYAYFDSNVAFISRLKSVDQLMEVLNKAMKLARYKIKDKGFLVEHFDVEQANKLLSSEDKQILTKEIKTERQLLAEQDKKLGLIKINGQELSRVQLYDLGTKISVEGGVPLLINADMELSNKKFQGHLDRKEVSMTAREYLENLKDSENVEEVVQATRSIPFEGSRNEIKCAQQMTNSILKSQNNQKENSPELLLGNKDKEPTILFTDNPATCLNDVLLIKYQLIPKI